MKKAPVKTAKNLAEAHASLLVELKELEEMLLPGSAATPLKAAARLAAIHTRITDHFGLEEQSGWIDALWRREPRFEHSAQRLLDEHRELVQSLNILIEEAEAANSLDDAYAEKVRRWIHRVRDHEYREDELLEESVSGELGAGD